MSLGICLITAGLPSPSPISDLIQKCGLEVWTPASPDAEDGRIYDGALCLVIDMPGEAGLRTLHLMRDYGVKTPALLIVDDAHEMSLAQLKNAWVLAVIPRTADPRKVLHWIESMCITHKLLERVRGQQDRQPELLSA